MQCKVVSPRTATWLHCGRALSEALLTTSAEPRRGHGGEICITPKKERVIINQLSNLPFFWCARHGGVMNNREGSASVPEVGGLLAVGLSVAGAKLTSGPLLLFACISDS